MDLAKIASFQKVRPQLIRGVTVQGPTNTAGLYCMNHQSSAALFGVVAVTNLFFILKNARDRRYLTLFGCHGSELFVPLQHVYPELD